MIHKNHGMSIESGITVAGAGLAGVCAAVSAARHGMNVAFVHDRPVIGGNSSSEIRIWTCGATAMGNNRYADETGIINEIIMENLYKNPEGNPTIWDMILLDFVKREDGIQLFLNTYIDAVEMQNDSIMSISGYQSGTEKQIVFRSKIFIDCTGDGTIGFLSGAEYMQGRESKAQYGESLAMEIPDQHTLGSTLLFYVKNAGATVLFHPPGFAYSKEKIEELLIQTGKRIDIRKDGCDLWWIEFGGVFDTIGDNEFIKEELQRLVYGIWDYIKNSGKFDSENLTLEWVGSIPGKRESRRLKGPYVLHQQDLTIKKRSAAAVCYGGWPIDTHPEKGIYTDRSSCHQTPVGIYDIPLECLYSCNIKNLMFAGRDISVSHIAFASTRVMKTCALTGQAAGTAAALVIKNSKLPFELSVQEINDLQQMLLKDDCWIVGIKNQQNLASVKNAELTVSGHKAFESKIKDDGFVVDKDIYIVFPPLQKVENISLLLDAMTDTTLRLEIYQADKTDGTSNLKQLKEISMEFRSLISEWVDIQVGLQFQKNENIIIKLLANRSVRLYTAKDKCCGVFGSREFLNSLDMIYPCFKIGPLPDYFTKDHLLNGFNRPYEAPNVWVSSNISESPVWLQFQFQEVVSINEIHVYFNNDLNRDYNNLKPDYYQNGWDKMPSELVKDFCIYALTGDEIISRIADVKDNYLRHFVCKEIGIKADRIRIEITGTWGSDYAEIFEVGIYQGLGI